MIYGYLRVSTDKQNTRTQRFEIVKFSKEKSISIDRWIEEKVSGTTSPKARRLGAIFKKLNKGDIIVTTELSRLGRNLMQVMSFLNQCMEKEICVLTVKERYELGNSINSKILAFAFSLSAEIERSLISQRTKEALARKKQEGYSLGRPKGSSNVWLTLYDNRDIIIQMIDNKETISDISRYFNVSRQTIRRFLKEIGDEIGRQVYYPQPKLKQV